MIQTDMIFESIRYVLTQIDTLRYKLIQNDIIRLKTIYQSTRCETVRYNILIDLNKSDDDTNEYKLISFKPTRYEGSVRVRDQLILNVCSSPATNKRLKTPTFCEVFPKLQPFYSSLGRSQNKRVKKCIGSALFFKRDIKLKHLSFQKFLSGRFICRQHATQRQ